jgi:hypothetical protein
MHGACNMKTGPTIAELELRFFIDQMSERPTLLILGDLENRITQFISQVNGVYLSRNVEIGERKVVDYKFRLNDYDSFYESLTLLSRKRLDKEFTEALESKLSED